jgi:hypothetical protein
MNFKSQQICSGYLIETSEKVLKLLHRLAMQRWTEELLQSLLQNVKCR